ncbi:FtsX-like permease family protein [Kordiimonas sp. SCSIO 12610]|uniref:ABC transporter permease n=1 Tax=Kordiimonas sp. SCSIO 12610 TaxID=2829597 RepID=UPI00210D813A|nr:FtsX-like permease family protein [Kordiimonas sp. SCSIO 12610]UTW55658.1 ABC transporter permease [Kordiimonas sp. SCSIO 12610]
MATLISYFRASFALWRNQWVGVVIALMGLTIASAISIIAVLYVLDGFTSDIWLKNSDRLYRIESQVFSNGNQNGFTRNARAKEQHAAFVRENFNEIEAVTRLQQYQFLHEINGREEYVFVYLADANLAEVLDFPVIVGDISTALSKPNGVILSRSKAKAMFGRADYSILGKSIAYGRESYNENQKLVKTFRNYTIHAVIDDIPANSSFDLDIILPRPDDIRLFNFPVSSTLLKLKSDIDYPAFKAQLEKQLTDNTPPFRSYSFEFYVEPLVGAAIRLNVISGTGSRLTTPRTLWTIVTIAFILLFAAGFNYVSIFTAINSLRGREIAVRRISGAGYQHIAFTCLLEGAILASITFGVAVLIADDLTNIFTDLSNVDVPILVPYRAYFLFQGLSIAITLGIVGAIYPALLMHRVRPETLLRNNINKVTGGRGRIRQTFVAIQAFICVGVFIASLQVAWQMNHILTVERGFTTEGVFFLSAPNQQDNERFQTGFIDEVRKLPGVENADTATNILFNGTRFSSHYRGPNDVNPVRVRLHYAGPSFFNLLKTAPLARLNINISKNQIALPLSSLPFFGFRNPEDALGKTFLDTDSISNTNEGHRYTVVAVIEDLKDELSIEDNSPKVYQVGSPDQINYIVGQVSNLSSEELNNSLKAKWAEFFPGQPYRVEWLVDRLRARYQTIQDTGFLFNFISTITLILSIAGVYGMAQHWFITHRRELALRRIMGADQKQIISLAVRRMLMPTIIGGVLAFTPVWYLMQKWLTSFIENDALPFIVYGLVLLVISTLSGLSLWGHITRALREHPATVLNYE